MCNLLICDVSSSQTRCFFLPLSLAVNILLLEVLLLSILKICMSCQTHPFQCLPMGIAGLSQANEKASCSFHRPARWVFCPLCFLGARECILIVEGQPPLYPGLSRVLSMGGFIQLVNAYWTSSTTCQALFLSGDEQKRKENPLVTESLAGNTDRKD